MGWGSWSRKNQDTVATREPLGVDLNAGRARAAHGKAGRNKLFVLDDPWADLSLSIALDKRTPEMGRPAVATCRRTPHLICASYLPHLGRTMQWQGGRHTLNSEAAVELALQRLRAAVSGHDGIALALPTYMTQTQVRMLTALTDKAKIKLRGTATIPLALAAERATHFLHGENTEASKPGRPVAATNILIVDGDDHALTVTAVRLSETDVRTLASAALPKLGLRYWRERLLDAIADRCVRHCRRDPRDSAETEQMLFDQLDEAIERARLGQKASLSIRSAHWYQDVDLAPTDLDLFCSTLSKAAADEMLAFLHDLKELEPPKAVWLTHDVGRLPGLAAVLHHNLSVKTNVRVLHPEAAAAATANLIERWQCGELPRTHLDAAIALGNTPRSDGRLMNRPSAARP